ncbi:hypothetical protein P154DRAFT_495674 [Amniculicola lignicola CBS 123094]|uniref:AGC-kinase C-terminal domain-containing protein n=1 Tax=Amniculicola lignicola CBS 123094 TaxID=1392246 RepID=A0A6A5W8U2_9PLEO|nr:hypothetical protein P154DRAFT_495674 [Amniculicola lignicola CBS 123094]
MFSYLRPHARRNASSSALSPEPASAPAQPAPSPSIQAPEYFTSLRPGASGSHAAESPVSPYPPQLPPIPRVASRVGRSGNSSAVASPQYPMSPPSGHLPGRIQPAEEPGTRPPTHPQDRLSPSHDTMRPSSRSTTGSQPAGYRSPAQSLAQVVEQAVQAEAHPAPASSTLSPSMVSANYSANSRSQTSLVSGISDRMTGGSRSSTPTTSSSWTTSQRTGKSRLNLRNPMSLLMRRRSGQTLEQLSDEALVTQRSPSIVPPMPDDYDPSIRGRIVHDFSAPRVNRNFSYNNAYGSEPGGPASATNPNHGRVSPPKIEREHTPVFREHFDDDTSYEASQAAIRAEQLVNKDFLARNSLLPPPDRSPPPPPPPKDSPPPPTTSPPSVPPPPPPDQAPAFEASVLSPVQEASSPIDGLVEVTPRKKKSTKTPPASRSRATSITDPSFNPAGLPTHLTSRSSRFSFQIAGNDSAQEKVLEEGYKRKAAEKASKEVRMSTNTIDDEYDEYGMGDYDDMDDGGFEEDIPMVGEYDNYGDDGLGDDSMSPGMAAFDFSQLSIHPMSPAPMHGEIQTPIDANGNVIGFAVSHPIQDFPPQSNGADSFDEPQGLGLLGLDGGAKGPSSFAPTGNVDMDTMPKSRDLDLGLGLDDDMYFDDGMIAEQGDVDAVEFDENVFDDPSHPFFERKVKPPPPEELRTNALFSNPPEVLSEAGYEADEDEMMRLMDKTEPSLAHKTSVAQQNIVPDTTNLNAYHSALADAAHRAEAEGRFFRKASVDVGRPSSDIDDSSSLSNSRPSLVPDDGRFSQETTGFPPEDDGFGMDSSFLDDYDCSDYDSALENDPMIAAANAEALANDYEGIYGQEFGFYAAAQGESTNAWGGFFGPSGLGRSVSGRNAVREPNLTPITERSEYSTRNSFISLNHFRDGQQPIQSPGLAQLARMSPYGWPDDDQDMTMDALMKLRKGAFGSTASLGSGSGNSPRNSSPIGMQYFPRNGSPMTNHPLGTDHIVDSDDSAPVGGSYDGDGDEDDEALDAVNAGSEDFDEEDEDGIDSRADSPTLTASDYNTLSSPTYGHDQKDIPPLPLPVQGHSRKGSAADSVTYVREHDESGGDRWVLERRRTAESGELELVGREIVEGGRI